MGDARLDFDVQTQELTREWRLKPLKSLKMDAGKGDPPARGRGSGESIGRIPYK
jgi:hypothetical protein